MLNHKMTQCRAMKTLECYEQDGKSVKKDDFVKFVFLRCCEGHFHSKVVLETWQISFLVVCIIHIHQNASSQILIFSRRFYIFTSNKSPGQTGPVGKFSHHYASQWQLHKAQQLVKYAAAYIALRNQWTNDQIVKYAAVSRQFVLLVD